MQVVRKNTEGWAVVMPERIKTPEQPNHFYVKLLVAAAAVLGIVYFEPLQPAEDAVVFVLEGFGEGTRAMKG